MASDPTWSQRVLGQLRHDTHLPAVVSVTPEGTQEYSRSEFSAMTAGACAFLDDGGVAEGEQVVGLLSTRPWSIAMLLACALTNRPLAPLGHRLTRRELLACIENIAGNVILTEPEWLDMASDLAAATGRRVLVVSEPVLVDRALPEARDPDAIALVMHTSGTTGLPKQVLVTEAALAQRATVNGRLLGLEPGARFVMTALFHHIAAIGNIAVALANGATVVMFPAFSVAAWRSLEAVAPTHAVLVVSTIETLLDAGALVLPSLRVIGYGASPIHPDTLRRIQLLNPDVDFVNLFGQTEGSPLTVLSPEDHRAAVAGRPELLKSVGRAAPGVELKIHDAGPDGVGEIWARCAHSFVVDAEGWQHTGDIGRLDDEGYLYLVGRRGDKIIRGGENIYPLEVEQVLATHPGVLDAGVVGIPDRRLGETVAAVVVPADPGNPPDSEELRAFCRERLAGFKIPVQWRYVDALPRNPNGKLLRRELGSTAGHV
ncbi:class I adenylate-forming enzyme family protein [Mycolicibacterium sp. XJ1819]